jgi:hypothetical protein
MSKLRFAACIFSLCSFVSALTAQTAPKTHRSINAENDPMIRELNHYTLTDANLKKFMAAQQNIDALIKSNPSLKDRSVKGDLLENSNFDQGAAKLDSQFPEFAAAIHKAGLSSREYLVFTMAVFQSAMYSGLRKQGTKLPPDVNQANVDFVDRHQAEIQQLSQDMKKNSNNKEDKDDQQDKQ